MCQGTFFVLLGDQKPEVAYANYKKEGNGIWTLISGFFPFT
jgi:hypothetical protein